jgi:hypothetical protein
MLRIVQAYRQVRRNSRISRGVAAVATVQQICMGIHVREPRWSSSQEDWALILNSNGVDVLNKTVSYRGEGDFDDITVLVFSEARGFPPENFARVYRFGAPVPDPDTPPFSDQVEVDVLVDTAQLTPSSARFAIHGPDLIRPQHLLLWGFDAAMAVVPLTLDVDMAVDVSEDPVEGPASIPLTLVDSGNDSTPLNEVILYVALDKDPNAGTQQPASFRVEDADGAILFESELENFGELVRDTRTSLGWRDAQNAQNARFWRLTETAPPFTRVDGQGRPVVAKLRVTGPDNAMIQAVVAFGVNRDGPRPVIVPLVHHIPSIAQTNPWVGTHQDVAGRDMLLPLCPMAARQ